MRRALVLALVCARLAGCARAASCGYQSCAGAGAAPGALSVHVVAHTHDDVGWVRTADQYYRTDVRQILDSVISELDGHPQRRFTYVETAFFWRWWLEQAQETRARVRGLVQRGQLTFAGGAWAMNDEAAAHYQSILDQFTWGLRKLVKTFGQCGMPLVGWQIDPFGHSREFASLLAAMGYDGLFLGRVDHQDRSRRLAARAMETLWRGDDDLGNSSDIFASVLYFKYDDPPGFCYDARCSDPAPDEAQASKFIEYALGVAQHYATNNVLLTFGRDFAFSDAAKNFRSIDRLIELTNQQAAQRGLAVRAFYSTPACYLRAVKDAEPAPTLPPKQDDFFPYASDARTYWAGYFSSRAAAKRLEREASGWLQMVKQLQVLAGLTGSARLAVEELKSALGVMQHHDAITGTAREHVAREYVRALHAALHAALAVPREALHALLAANSSGAGGAALQFHRCALNESRCRVSETSPRLIYLHAADARAVQVAAYNALAWRVRAPVRVPVVEGDYAVYAPTGKQIVSQTVRIPPHVLRIPTRQSAATHEIVFIAHLKPLMLKTYFVEKKLSGKVERSVARQLDDSMPPRGLANEHMNLSINYTTGKMSLASLADGARASLRAQFAHYRGAGGAYVLRPLADRPQLIATDTLAGARGPVVQEMTISSDTASSVVRIYSGLRYIENEWVAGPIDVQDGYGKNYVVRYVTDVVNKGQFYTDSNGRQMLKRILNRRPQWSLEVDEPVAGNYYPVTNKIYIEDDQKRVVIVTDRSEGGTSLEEGQIELMLHRRLLNDDRFGMGEALNEEENGHGLVIRGRHRILLTRLKSYEDKLEEKKEVFQMHLQPYILIANAVNLPTTDKFMDPFAWWMSSKKSISFANTLPEGVHLLSLEPWEESTFLLRLENFLEKSDKENTTVQVDLNKIFKYIHVVSFKETLLAGQLLMNEKKKWVWKTKENFMKNFNEAYGSNENIQPAVDVERVNYDNGTKVTLAAKEIRTFIVFYRIKRLRKHKNFMS